MSVPTEYTNFAGHDRFKIQCITPGLNMEPVIFNYNPEKMTYRRTSKSSPRGTATGSTGSQLEKTELILIELNEIIFEGWDTKARCDLLLSWACPPDATVDRIVARAMGQAVKLPKLLFQWGTLFGEVIMKSCTVVYERFDRETAMPFRAKISLGLELQPNLLGISATNPTSGGLPDRRSHQMRQGENLVQVTTDEYGHPRYWRQLAKANNVDDPLRMKPGQYVYVPNLHEVPKD